MRKCYILFISLLSVVVFGDLLDTSIGATYGPLIHKNDLVYLGAFRVPKGDLGDDSTNYDRLGYGGSAIAFNSLRNSLFIVGHPYGNRVVEISIPEILDSNNLSDLKTATVVQSAVDITEGHLADLALDGSALSHPVPGGFLLFNDRLIGTAYVYYDGGGRGYRSHFYASPNWSETGPNFHGMYRVGEADGGGPNGGFVGGYMALIPPAWRSTLGGPALTGLGGISVITRSSYGPCAWVFNPDNLGNKDPVPATMLVGYPQGHETLGTWGGISLYFNMASEIKGLVFPYGTSTVLFFGRHGLGPTGEGDTCYGIGTGDQSLAASNDEYCYDPTDNSKGCHGYPYVYRVWAYDARDLAKVKSGEMKPWDVRPYAIWNLDFPFSIENAQIVGAAYDPSTQRIFISEYGGDQTTYDPYPLIHVYKVNISGGDGETGAAPSVPDSLRADGASSQPGQVHLLWNPSTGDVTGYRVYYGTVQGTHTQMAEVGDTTENTVNNLQPNTTYYFVVRAYNDYGESGDSNEISYTPTAEGGSTSDTITVSTASELQNAVSNLTSGTTILLNNGTYNLTNSLLISGGLTNITIKGASGDRDSVIIKGPGMSYQNYGNAGFGIVIANAQDVTIQDLTVQDFYFHDIMIKSEEGAKRPVLRNLHLKDAGEQLIKVTAAPNQTSYCDGGVVENCLIEYTDRGRSWYTNAIDALAAKDWIVRDNEIRNIRAPEGQLAGPAILFWQNSIDTIVERNRIINCDRGIALGLAGPGQYARNGETTYDHQGGIIRNNFIYRNQGGDVGITVNKAKDFKILNNTVILQGSFPWTIEYRFSSSSGIIANNLTDGPIQQRDGAQATLTTNLTSAQLNWFVNASVGDLHLSSNAVSAIDHGSVLSDVTDDIDKDSRSGTVDIGADELSSGTVAISPPATLNAKAANSIDLSWSKVNGAAGYNVYRSTTSGSGYVKINSALVTTTSYVDQNTTPGTTYYYVVTSVDSAGNESGYSPEAHATEPLANRSPSITSFTAQPNPAGNPLTTVTLSVQASDPDGDALTYTIDFGDNSPSVSGNTATHAYSSKDTYTATATVSDGHGHSVSQTLQVTVNDNAPAEVTGVQAQ